MGEAKNRGTQEERAAEAQERDARDDCTVRIRLTPEGLEVSAATPDHLPHTHAAKHFAGWLGRNVQALVIMGSAALDRELLLRSTPPAPAERPLQLISPQGGPLQ